MSHPPRELRKIDMGNIIGYFKNHISLNFFGHAISLGTIAAVVIILLPIWNNLRTKADTITNNKTAVAIATNGIVLLEREIEKNRKESKDDLIKVQKECTLLIKMIDKKTDKIEDNIQAQNARMDLEELARESQGILLIEKINSLDKNMNIIVQWVKEKKRNGD